MSPRNSSRNCVPAPFPRSRHSSNISVLFAVSSNAWYLKSNLQSRLPDDRQLKAADAPKIAAIDWPVVHVLAHVAFLFSTPPVTVPSSLPLRRPSCPTATVAPCLLVVSQ